MSPDLTALCFWHGSQRWSGTPQLQPARPKCYEHGPGLYLTTALPTARKYARGAGKAVLVEVDPNLTFLEDAKLTLAQQLEGLAQLPRVRHRKAVEAGLCESAARHPVGNPIPAIYLLNYLVNYDALGGEAGPALARWFVAQGIDASRAKEGREESWVVLFNLDKIRRAQPLPAAQADAIDSFSPLELQRLQLQGQAAPAPSVRLRPR